jgi:hypothetical protein
MEKQKHHNKSVCYTSDGLEVKEDPQVLGDTVQNKVATAIWRPGLFAALE